jgi:cobalt-zinc-cadmium efflux system membrane fusion protein
MKTPAVALAGVVLLLSVPFLAGGDAPKSGVTETVHKEEIRIETAEARELDEFVHAHGAVEYDETRLAQIGSRVPGIAWRVDKKVGDEASKGDVLAILDSGDVGQAKAELLEAAITFHLKAETWRRLEKARSAIPEQTIRKARADEKLARVRLFNARQKLIDLGLPLPADWDSDPSCEECARRIQFLGIPQTVARGFGPEVATANLIPLVAPFDGVVIDREIVTGEVVATGPPQFVIADVSRMLLKLNVHKADAARLEIGQEVWFSSDGVPGEVRSRLSWIAPEVDEKTQEVQVRAEAENPILQSVFSGREGQPLLRAHTRGTARIRVRDERRVVVVPSTAIWSDGGKFTVFVPLSDGRSFQPRDVVVGVTRDGRTEIVRGIRAGERIVASGPYSLKGEMRYEETARNP